MSKRSKGFTLIEVLLAIGILVLLMGMLTVGIGVLSRSGKEKATRQTLENCRAILAASDAINRLRPIVDNGIYTSLAVSIDSPGAVFGDAPDRDGLIVRKTQAIMNILWLIPDSRRAIEQLPSEQLMRLEGTGADEAPVVLDAWGNPIIFVPGGGLKDVELGGQPSTVKATDGRPFFASAGPDGDFARGEDNLYSFEN